MSVKIENLFKVDGIIAVITGGGTGTVELYDELYPSNSLSDISQVLV